MKVTEMMEIKSIVVSMQFNEFPVGLGMSSLVEFSNRSLLNYAATTPPFGKKYSSEQSFFLFFGDGEGLE